MSYRTVLVFYRLGVFFFPFCLYFQVMETERMIYLVTEYASGGEIFGKGLPSRRLRLSLLL